MNSKFIQITVVSANVDYHEVIYALDSEGDVWYLVTFKDQNKWTRLTTEREQ